MTDKFRVQLPKTWMADGNTYFEKFWTHCNDTALANDWSPMTVANYELRPLGGRLITTRTQGWYLRWDREACHTAFLLKWT